ncbi:MAG: efflux RND transporter periplasmic adaptor subunit [Pseudomonadota bacterium]
MSKFPPDAVLAMPPPAAATDRRPTGAAMDQPLPPRRARRLAIGSVLLALAAGSTALWQLAPRGLQVPLAQARFAVVEQGVFRDELALRATAAPLRTVMLDAVESGRVEEVLARDGASVRQGELLFRLSNPQRRLELLAREAEHAQQISNLTNLRVAAEASRAARQRRGAELAYALTVAEKQHGRDLALARQGYLSSAALEDASDRLAQQRALLDAEVAGNATQTAIERDALRQMELAIARLEAGLQLVHATLDGLAVRAPAPGRLTDFHLQLGETVRPDQHLGRIDDVARFKLSAQADEYYLARLAPGHPGVATIAGHGYAVTVSRITPQINDGRFTLELTFDRQQPPAISPGQSAEVSVALGGSRPALLLPNDAFINDTGGAWVYVLDGRRMLAARRAIRTGRRSPGQLEVLAGLAAGERVLVSSYAAYGAAPVLQFNR